tara:strand:- start:1437 stop:2819 length:1383 start_codon:yes stop_codon:yes gene_type:complete
MLFFDVEKHGNQCALITEQNECISYSQLDHKIDEFIHSNLLFESNFKRLFLVEAKASAAFVVCYLACLRVGHSLLLLSPDSANQSRSAILKSFKVNGVIYTNGSEPVVEELSGNDLSIHADLALLLATSGSTGAPKYVRLSYRNLQANAESISAYLPLTADEVAITSLPLSYSYGLSILNSHLLAGACIVLSELSIMERQFWDLMVEHSVTSFSGVPYSYSMLKRLNFKDKDLPNLRYMTQAGGKLAKTDALYFNDCLTEKGRRFFIMYGQTEATARMSYVPPESLPEKADSIGVAIPGGRFELIAEDGKIITDTDQIGELVYYGDNVMMGYALSVNDLSKPSELNGLKTGDLAVKDNDGFMKIVGRKSRFIKLFGSRIDLDQIERVMLTQKLEVACVGNDQQLHVFLNDIAGLDEMKRYLHQQMSIHPSVIVGHQIDSFPRTASKKIHYATLATLAGLS